jgi:hypothetical protein
MQDRKAHLDAKDFAAAEKAADSLLKLLDEK